MDKKEERSFNKGKRYCLRLLSLRARTEREIEERLKKAGYGDHLTKKILDSLKKEDLVDDLDFAREWIDWRMRENPKGRRLLVEELRKKGIDDRVIETALEEKRVILDDVKIAQSIIENRLSAEDAGKLEKVKAKVFRLLISKGFDPETAESVIRAALD